MALSIINEQLGQQQKAKDLQSVLPVKRFDINQTLRLYVASDIIALFFSFFCGWLLTVGINEWVYGRDMSLYPFLFGRDTSRFLQFSAIAGGVTLWFQHTDHYRMRMPFWLEMKKVVCALAFAMLVDGFFQFTGRHDFSRIWLVSGWLVAIILVIALRVGVRAVLKRKGMFAIPTLLVGSGETAKAAREALRSEPGLGYEITAQIKNLPVAFIQEGRSWRKLCSAYGVGYVVIALEGNELAAAEQPLAQLMREDVPFSVSPPLRHMPVMGMVPQYFFNHDTMLLTRSSGLEQPLPRIIKRTVDVLVSGSALLLLSPIMLVLAFLVKRDGGKAFFGHVRVGKNGKPFSCLKFRSMIANSDEVLQKTLESDAQAREEWEATRKLKNDPRITRVGAFLRKSSLDELPQLINVLRGDMSLVGPRPIVAAEVSNYESDIAHYYRVRPGITGLWQVSGRNDVSYAQRVQMDSWYVRNWSLWHDIAILFKTVPAVFKSRGAY